MREIVGAHLARSSQLIIPRASVFTLPPRQGSNLPEKIHKLRMSPRDSRRSREGKRQGSIENDGIVVEKCACLSAVAEHSLLKRTRR